MQTFQLQEVFTLASSCRIIRPYNRYHTPVFLQINKVAFLRFQACTVRSKTTLIEIPLMGILVLWETYLKLQLFCSIQGLFNAMFLRPFIDLTMWCLNSIPALEMGKVFPSNLMEGSDNKGKPYVLQKYVPHCWGIWSLREEKLPMDSQDLRQIELLHWIPFFMIIW